MNINDSVLKNEEKAIFGMRSLYRKYGYSQYKMSKFEEYDLYVRNKDFLVSDNIISFTDTNGRLMALKPDVTLSIIKNGSDAAGVVQKVFYDENVYRVSKGSHAFKEIMQVGLECIGAIDNYCIYEVLMLAAESLRSISAECVLDVSHLGIVSAVIDGMNVEEPVRNALLKCIGEKNAHEIAKLCTENSVSEDAKNRLLSLVSTYGDAKTVLPELKALCTDDASAACLDQLMEVVTALEASGCGDVLRIDFSVTSDMNYYNGIVFRGFVRGIPTGILSGGQYDKLMQKMGRKSGAIGFAVYLDMLEDLSEEGTPYDADTVILYTENDDMGALRSTVRMLTDAGQRVCAQKAVPEKMRYKQLLRLNGKGVEILETNA
ncbi:MAG: ATP phosphoribosyltransferase regulatory subunit [Clostridia bacterium]|nr:ATP phosphoribosyltransferase regulatory subunit [Clostridia bacterium]